MERVTVLFPVPLGPSMVTMGGTESEVREGWNRWRGPAPEGLSKLGGSSDIGGENGAGDLSLPDQGSRRPVQMHAHRELPAPTRRSTSSQNPGQVLATTSGWS